MKKRELQKWVGRLVQASFEEGKMEEQIVTKSIKALKSLSVSESINALSKYLHGLKAVARQYTMYIESTIPLSLSQIKKIRKVMEKKHKITGVVTKINPAILGGFTLKIGDKIYDESIMGKLIQIKEAITNG